MRDRTCGDRWHAGLCPPALSHDTLSEERFADGYTIHILIADDQAITRSGLRTLLESVPDLEIVGEATNGAEVIELAVSLQPDVILMDLRMPEINGIEATRRIHRASPHIGILVVTIFEDDTSVFPAIRAGARGYLLKDADQNELVQAIKMVAPGGVIFSAGIAHKVLQYFSAPPPSVPKQAFDELTNRERDVLGWGLRCPTRPIHDLCNR